MTSDKPVGFLPAFLLTDKQAAAPDIAAVGAAEHLKGTIGVNLADILGLDEGAGMDVGKVDNVDGTGLRRGQELKGILDIAHKHFHPGGGTKPATAHRISLRKQFRHAIFRMDLIFSEGPAKPLVQFFPGELFPPALHATGLHHEDVFAQRKVVCIGKIKQGKGDPDQQGLLF